MDFATWNSDSIFGALTGIPVVGSIVNGPIMAILSYAMNTTKRLIYGVLSCLLLAAGFARAADQLDPISKIARHSAHDLNVRSVDGPVAPSTPTTGGVVRPQ